MKTTAKKPDLLMKTADNIRRCVFSDLRENTYVPTIHRLSALLASAGKFDSSQASVDLESVDPEMWETLGASFVDVLDGDDGGRKKSAQAFAKVAHKVMGKNRSDAIHIAKDILSLSAHYDAYNDLRTLAEEILSAAEDYRTLKGFS